MPMKKAGKKSTAKKGAKKSTGKKSAKKSKSTTAAGKKAAGRRAPSKSPARRAAATKAKRTPGAAFMKPMTPSPELGAIVGARPMPRTEVTKRVWDYIKKNGLQDQKNRRMINADENLGKVFGGRKQVSMFEMTKLVNNHLK